MFRADGVEGIASQNSKSTAGSKNELRESWRNMKHGPLGLNG